jgi:putative membrane protein
MWSRRTDPEHFFDVEEREAIRRAAAEAESHTSGEVVPYVVGRCDDYPGAGWAAAAWGALLAAGVSGLLNVVGGFWGGLGPVWITLPVLGGAAGGWALAWWLPGFRRRLMAPAVIEQRVERRAALAFLDEEVFATRERTGILIFLALYEHRVVVLADAGINAKVDQAEWDDIVAHLRAGIRRGEPAAALVEAIEACGRLLRERDVEIRPDDANELRDHLRIADE